MEKPIDLKCNSAGRRIYIQYSGGRELAEDARETMEMLLDSPSPLPSHWLMLPKLCQRNIKDTEEKVRL